jgi:hypothetical protein
MSDLLNSASLVVIPSGYKEDTVYSVVPSDGSGDLSFTRASNGTRVNSAGLVEVCPWNLLQESETFDSATWTKTGGASITANNTTAPNGTLTADRINVAASTYSGAYQFINQPNGVYANSIYAKAGTFNYLFVLINGSSGYYVWFNLATGTIGSKGANMEGTIESVGDGWYRCTVSRILNNDTNNYHQFGFSNAEDYTPATTGTAYIWGAQTNIGSTAKPYFPTTDRLNVPRLTYQNGGGGCPSLLLEKQSTNIVTYSEDFSNSDWSKQNISITANATTSPDGTQNADKLIANTTNARHLTFQAFVVSTTHTFTTYAKAGENSFLIMRLDTDTPEVKTWFNLSNGTIGTSQGGSPTITSVGNGWYRCSVQFVSSTSQTIYAVLYTATTDNQEVFAGNNSDGTFIYGAQVEASSYPTSYIPTTSSSATRVADACFKTGISSLIGSTTGSVFVDFEIFTTSEFGGIIEIINTSSTGQRLLLWENASTSLELNISGGIGGGSIGTTATIGRHKAVFTYTASAIKFFLDGVKIGQTTPSTLTGGFDKLDFEHSQGGVFIQKKNINQALVFTSELTEAEAIALTTI